MEKRTVMIDIQMLACGMRIAECFGIPLEQIIDDIRTKFAEYQNLLKVEDSIERKTMIIRILSDIHDSYDIDLNISKIGQIIDMDDILNCYVRSSIVTLAYYSLQEADYREWINDELSKAYDNVKELDADVVDALQEAIVLKSFTNAYFIKMKKSISILAYVRRAFQIMGIPTDAYDNEMRSIGNEYFTILSSLSLESVDDETSNMMEELIKNVDCERVNLLFSENYPIEDVQEYLWKIHFKPNLLLVVEDIVLAIKTSEMQLVEVETTIQEIFTDAFEKTVDMSLQEVTTAIENACLD